MALDVRPIHFLSLEDDDLDAELLRERLSSWGPRTAFRRVKTEREYLEALRSDLLDVILSDFSLPGYDGLAALSAAQNAAPDVPFIFVSGAIGEERAIESLQRGATDYVLKDRLERLLPAVTRALKLADERRGRRQAEAERDRLLVSERQAREFAEAANRMKDEFLAVVSHELRTPLNAILGWANLLVSREADPALLSKALSTIERNARLQSRLIDDILDISRIITGKLQLRASGVSVAAFIQGAVEAVTPAAEAKGITLTLHAAGVGEVVGDADRLQQVVWNLLSNAIKFTPAGGHVAVLATRSDDAVSITVSDTGCGIDPAFLPHVFDRFRQADATMTRRHGGLGLGLAIVRHLVELHGGSASAESPGVGRGSHFSIRLPVRRICVDEETPTAPVPASSCPPSSRERPPTSVRGIRALVVDDEADTRELVAHMLRSGGASVIAVSSVAEALDALSRERPDVIISDIGMPEIDGYSFLRSVRARGAASEKFIPAIALTAYVRDLDRRQAEAAGYQRHLAKPVTAAALVAAVAELTRGQSG